MASSADRNPQHHTQKMKTRLQEIVTHLREDIQRVENRSSRPCLKHRPRPEGREPQLKAMFETSAEVLSGLIKAFSDYEKKNEAAWRKSA